MISFQLAPNPRLSLIGDSNNVSGILYLHALAFGLVEARPVVLYLKWSAGCSWVYLAALSNAAAGPRRARKATVPHTRPSFGWDIALIRWAQQQL